MRVFLVLLAVGVFAASAEDIVSAEESFEVADDSELAPETPEEEAADGIENPPQDEDVDKANQVDEKAEIEDLEIQGDTPEEAVKELAELKELAIQYKLCTDEVLRKSHPELEPLTREDILKEDAHITMLGDERLELDELKEELLPDCLESLGKILAKRVILNFSRQPRRKWGKNIKYCTDEMSSKGKDQIKASFETIKQQLGDLFNFQRVSCGSCKEQCIRFHKQTPTRETSCSGSSPLGKSYRIPQVININECKWDRVMIPVIIHELGHSWGFPHTQNRPDREKYVNINLNNVQKSARSQYAMVNPVDMYESFGVPYDFDSDMHYRDRTFQEKGKGPTMSAKNPRNQARMGKATKYSPGDIKMLKGAYGGSSGGSSDGGKPSGGGSKPSAPSAPSSVECRNSAGKWIKPGQKDTKALGSRMKLGRTCTKTGEMTYTSCSLSVGGKYIDGPVNCAKIQKIGSTYYVRKCMAVKSGTGWRFSAGGGASSRPRSLSEAKRMFAGYASGTKFC